MRNGELRKGIKVESEHAHTLKFIKRYVSTNNKFPPKKLIYMSIAKDHLKEDKKYYSKLAKAKL